MDSQTRQGILAAHGLSTTLLAVDPSGCGCTECLIGEYIPADQILSSEVGLYQDLIRQGVLGDHTDGWFMPAEEETYTREDMARAFREGRESIHDGLVSNPYED